jgi:YfiH family protein
VGVRIIVTDRAGGVSTGPYASLNLGDHVGDDPAAVAANRARLAARLGVPVAYMTQRHGAGVAVVRDEAPAEPPEADALVTDHPGLAVAVLVADCVPVVVAGQRSVAVVHAGRRGVVAGVVGAAVEALRSLDDLPVSATVGPAICGRCYEVPEELQAAVAAIAPGAAVRTAAGTAGLDLPQAVAGQLAAAGVDAVTRSATCVAEDPAYYSHRRDGVTGRFAVLAMLVP